MTNESLIGVLKNIDISKGKVVREVDNLTAILMENHMTRQKSQSGRIFRGKQTYLILLCNGQKAGIIMKCGTVDIHFYMYKKFRDKRILSRLINDGFLKELWPDIEFMSCCNKEDYAKIEHLSELCGIGLTSKTYCW